MNEHFLRITCPCSPRSRCIPHNEMIVLAGDMNGSVGSSNAGYDWTHGGFGYGERNADGSRILVCRRAKLSHMQHTVYEAGIPDGGICSWSC